MPYRRARSFRQWFFEVFAPNERMPFEPLPMNQAERQEYAERERAEIQRKAQKDMTRLNLEGDPPKSN